tara:strand:- start:978 stop:1841 length:864 start_codon:yes stop_codon:yes gene_type:complete
MTNQFHIVSAQRGAISAAQAGLIVALLLAIAGGVVLLTGIWPLEEKPAPAVTTPPPAPPPAPIVAEIEEPTPQPPPPAPAAAPVEEPLPRLEESDDAVRDALGDIPLGTAGQQYLIPGNIIERSTSLIYLMAQGDVPYKLLPVSRPKAAFPFSDDGEQVVTDPAGFERYDALTEWIESLDLESLLSSLEWFIPLFREAWSYYGENPAAFDMAVVMTLDLMIATPEVDLSGARLTRKEAVWIFEDPAIEGLWPIQKQMLRMGPENAKILKAKAAEARGLWLDQLSKST